eukprot:CAMPEP_0172188112 /NCGR_PEP_ID=MMETSP1050-20130122/21724_1 /TAXON_ID=233186 /ORGANISM="Cryptomonas curvata, Strain CCAP979/52" /LENGTH=133 /DNA_ID=CAMNT_0012862533 /DNA_START=75 /DNA_END=473 /DNA_ORIENTATION=+
MPKRIRKAVGDQAVSFKQDDGEKDSDWIKINEVIRRINPRVLDDANRALIREPWRGEGTVQDSFDSPCVSSVSDIGVVTSSPDALRSTRAVLAALAAEPPSDADPPAVSFGGTTIRLQVLPGWLGGTAAWLAK